MSWRALFLVSSQWPPLYENDSAFRLSVFA